MGLQRQAFEVKEIIIFNETLNQSVQFLSIFCFRKNITDIIIILLMMAYEKQNQIFKFNLSNTIVELNQQSLSPYLSDSMAQDLFEVKISILLRNKIIKFIFSLLQTFLSWKFQVTCLSSSSSSVFTHGMECS